MKTAFSIVLITLFASSATLFAQIKPVPIRFRPYLAQPTPRSMAAAVLMPVARSKVVFCYCDLTLSPALSMKPLSMV